MIHAGQSRDQAKQQGDLQIGDGEVDGNGRIKEDKTNDCKNCKLAHSTPADQQKQYERKRDTIERGPDPVGTIWRQQSQRLKTEQKSWRIVAVERGRNIQIDTVRQSHNINFVWIET